LGEFIAQVSLCGRQVKIIRGLRKNLKPKEGPSIFNASICIGRSGDAVHPDAHETTSDGIDSNCNGQDNCGTIILDGPPAADRILLNLFLYLLPAVFIYLKRGRLKSTDCNSRFFLINKTKNDSGILLSGCRCVSLWARGAASIL